MKLIMMCYLWVMELKEILDFSLLKILGGMDGEKMVMQGLDRLMDLVFAELTCMVGNHKSKKLFKVLIALLSQLDHNRTFHQPLILINQPYQIQTFPPWKFYRIHFHLKQCLKICNRWFRGYYISNLKKIFKKIDLYKIQRILQNFIF